MASTTPSVLDEIPLELTEIQAIEMLTSLLAPSDPSQYASSDTDDSGTPESAMYSLETAEDANREHAQTFYNTVEALLTKCSETIDHMEAKYTGMAKHFYLAPDGAHPTREVRQAGLDFKICLLRYVEGMRKELKQAVKIPENLTEGVVMNRLILNMRLVKQLHCLVNAVADQVGRVQQGNEQQLKKVLIEATERANGTEFARMVLQAHLPDDIRK